MNAMVEFGAPVSGIRMRGGITEHKSRWEVRREPAEATLSRLLTSMRGGAPASTAEVLARIHVAKGDLERAERAATTPAERAICLKARQDLEAIEAQAAIPEQFKAAVEGARQLARCRADLALKAAEAHRAASTPEAIAAGHLARARYEYQTGRAW